MAPILGHHKAFIVILGMLVWERQNERHYRQTVEEINHALQKDPISKEEGDN